MKPTLQAFRLSFLALACLTVPLSAQSYTSIVVFGDSLSDTGNFAHQTQSSLGISYPSTSFNYATGRFTDDTATTPTARSYSGVWVEQLARRFAANPAVKNSLDGGTNYAYGDATTADGYSNIPITAGLSVQVANMGQQVTNYLATNPIPSAATLYIVFGGANDLFADSSAASVTAAAQREANLVQKLINAGATAFVVPNLPPLGNTASYAGTPNAAALNTASAQFRTMLANDLQIVLTAATTVGKTVTISVPDLYTQFGAVASSPYSYGFANVTVSAQGLASTINPDTYLFWDGIHPTTAGHHLIAGAAENLLAPLVASTTTLTIAPTTVAPGTATTLTAVVTGTGSAKPSGGIAFFSGAGSSTTLIGSATLDATGKATATFTGIAAASPYSITAVYAGDLTFQNSTSPAQTLAVAATPVSTSTTLIASATSINQGAAETLTATVVSNSGTPTGSITFYDGTTALGAAVTLSNSGTASLMTTSLAIGSRSITAVYAPTGAFAASTSAAVLITVTAPAVGIAFSPSTLTLQHGSSGTVTISVTPIGGVSGPVTFACGALPSHASCLFSPATVTLSGSATQTSTLTIATNVAALDPLPGKLFGHGKVVFAFAMLPLLAFGTLRRKRAANRLCLLLFAGLASLTLAGCGSSSSSATSVSTAPGSYNVTVTATIPGSSSNYSANLTVVVQ